MNYLVRSAIKKKDSLLLFDKIEMELLKKELKRVE